MFILPTLQHWLPLAQGFLLCASLIIVIGPQNLFLIQQGLRRRHLLVTALLCTFFDLVLIGVGVGGLGAILAADTRWVTVTTLGGTAFLFGYGVRTLHSATYCQSVLAPRPVNRGGLSLKGTLLATASFSFLNPAAYIDTVLLIGGTSSHFPVDERLFFGIGAVTASCFWFFALLYGSSRLAPLLRHPTAWRVLDLVSGGTMIVIAGMIFFPHGRLSIGW